MYTLVISRHAERKIGTGEASGDGPLTTQGIADTQISYDHMAEELLRMKIRKIGLAVISGSVRGVQTFGTGWTVLDRKGIVVSEHDIDRHYFSTSEENKGWNKLYSEHQKEFNQIKAEFGEKEAYLQLASDLVKSCVDRIIPRIEAGFSRGCETILLVTHAPHDCLIEQHFTGHMPEKCLELGKYKILRF